MTEAAGVEAQREEIAPAQGGSDRDALTEMAAWMRERDDEDLALEQLKPGISPLRERIYELVEQLDDINQLLRDRAVERAKAISDLTKTMAEIERAGDRGRRRSGWRVRATHRTNARLREQHLARLREHQDRLLEHVPDPEAVLRRATELRDRQITLSRGTAGSTTKR